MRAGFQALHWLPGCLVDSWLPGGFLAAWWLPWFLVATTSWFLVATLLPSGYLGAPYISVVAS